MAQTSVNFRMDAELKESVEEICRKMRMNLTTAITIFCTKVHRKEESLLKSPQTQTPFTEKAIFAIWKRKWRTTTQGDFAKVLAIF